MIEEEVTTVVGVGKPADVKTFGDLIDQITSLLLPGASLYTKADIFDMYFTKRNLSRYAIGR